MSVGVEVKAGTNVKDFQLGSKVVNTNWVYGQKFIIREGGVYIWNGEFEREWGMIDGENVNVDFELNVPLPATSFGGKDRYVFPEYVKSLVWSLVSELECGATIKYRGFGQVEGDGGVDTDVSMATKDVDLIIYGKEYNIPFSSGAGIVSADGEQTDTSKQLKYSTGVNPFVHFDLPPNRQLSSYDVSIRAEFTLSMSVAAFERLVELEVEPWMRWNVGNPGAYTLSFMGYDTSIVASGDDVKDLIESMGGVYDSVNNVGSSVDKVGESVDKVDDSIKEQTDAQKGFFGKVLDFFGSFFQNLIDAVVSIFVPSKEDMSKLLHNLNLFFEHTFGFLYYPFEYFARVIDAFLETEYMNEPTVHFPSFSIMGYEVWPSFNYKLGATEMEKEVFSKVRMITSMMLCIWFIGYLRRFFDRKFGGDS